MKHITFGLMDFCHTVLHIADLKCTNLSNILPSSCYQHYQLSGQLLYHVKFFSNVIQYTSNYLPCVLILFFLQSVHLCSITKFISIQCAVTVVQLCYMYLSRNYLLQLLLLLPLILLANSSFYLSTADASISSLQQPQELNRLAVLYSYTSCMQLQQTHQNASDQQPTPVMKSNVLNQ